MRLLIVYCPLFIKRLYNNQNSNSNSNNNENKRERWKKEDKKNTYTHLHWCALPRVAIAILQNALIAHTHTHIDFTIFSFNVALIPWFGVIYVFNTKEGIFNHTKNRILNLSKVFPAEKPQTMKRLWCARFVHKQRIEQTNKHIFKGVHSSRIKLSALHPVLIL